MSLNREQGDRLCRSALIEVRYPGRFLSDLGGDMRDYVLLELGSARVAPFAERDIGSFVHDFVAEAGASDGVEDNRAVALRCVHPLVTLLEKLDAIARRFPRESDEAAAFVRHYEDAAHIIRRLDSLPALDIHAGPLAAEMLAQKQICRLPSAVDVAFLPDDTAARWAALRRAHERIQPMFWGPRIALHDACAEIRTWVKGECD